MKILQKVAVNKTCWCKLLVVCLLLGLVAAGCSGDTTDQVKTVDEAVALLQDIEDRSAWDALDDGLVDLAAHEYGYEAVARFTQESPDQDIKIDVLVDREGTALFTVTENEAVHTYYYLPGDTAALYRVEAGQDSGDYYCEQTGSAYERFHDGLSSLFIALGVKARTVQTLAVIDEVDDSENATWLDRDVIRYDVISRVPDALAVVARLDNTTLQARLVGANAVDLSGRLILDEDTWAMLSFDSTYQDSAAGQRAEFSFDITRWGDADHALEAIPAPGNDRILQPCSN
ncbi:MAG: hypothetical protein JXQ72_15020 [Anaerolineae bacterium]|nr:hypothetical protein [Anaerolineae bacterium]